MEITRRQMLKYSAAIAAASAIGIELPLPKGIEAAHVDKWVKGVCRYCGAGCGVYVGVDKGRVVAVQGDKDNWNKGFLCVKGYYLPPILYANDRAKYPLLKKDGKFVRISWKEAMDLMIEKFADSIKKHGVNSVAFYGSNHHFQRALTVTEIYFFYKPFGCLEGIFNNIGIVYEPSIISGYMKQVIELIKFTKKLAVMNRYIFLQSLSICIHRCRQLFFRKPLP